MQSYKDGVLSIYGVKNVSVPGNAPVDKLILKYKVLRYDEKTVGIKRYWTAKQQKANITSLLRTPKRFDVSTNDVAVVKGKQFKIEQVQYPEKEPLSMDLSLSRLEVEYDYGDES